MPNATAASAMQAPCVTTIPSELCRRAAVAQRVASRLASVSDAATLRC